MTATSPTPIAALPDLASALGRLRAVEAELNAAFHERRGEVASLICALVAREHVLLLGPPGTAKSALTEAFARAVTGGSFFQVLMTKYSVPEEVFGPISLTGLERDEYRRVTTGYLPESSVSFLDEIFKANSSILNSLLTALNERGFDNGGVRTRIPLEICVGASNELPQDDALAALYDRFVLRHWVEPVKGRGARHSLLTARAAPAVTARLQPGDLLVIRAAADAVVLTDATADAMLDLADVLAREHGVTCSDRRWRKMAALVCARAALAGRATTEPADLMVLQHAIWRTPDERPAVQATVAKAVSPSLGACLEILDAAIELHGKVMAGANSAGGAGTAALANAAREMQAMATKARSLPDVASDAAAQDVIARIAGLQMEVGRTAAKALGLPSF